MTAFERFGLLNIKLTRKPELTKKMKDELAWCILHKDLAWD
jgi:hypothetical protein